MYCSLSLFRVITWNSSLPSMTHLRFYPFSFANKLLCTQPGGSHTAHRAPHFLPFTQRVRHHQASPATGQVFGGNINKHVTEHAPAGLSALALHDSYVLDTEGSLTSIDGDFYLVYSLDYSFGFF